MTGGTYSYSNKKYEKYTGISKCCIKKEERDTMSFILKHPLIDFLMGHLPFGIHPFCGKCDNDNKKSKNMQGCF